MKFRRSKNIFKVSNQKIIKHPKKRKLFVTSIIQNQNNSATLESTNYQKSNKKLPNLLNSPYSPIITTKIKTTPPPQLKKIIFYSNKSKIPRIKQKKEKNEKNNKNKSRNKNSNNKNQKKRQKIIIESIKKDNEKKLQNENLINLKEKNKKYFYTGRWEKEEHKRFIDAIIYYGNDWHKVQQYVGTRTSTQARSHAQKFFEKLKKSKKLKFDVDFTKNSLKTLHDILEKMSQKEFHKTMKILNDVAFDRDFLKKKENKNKNKESANDNEVDNEKEYCEENSYILTDKEDNNILNNNNFCENNINNEEYENEELNDKKFRNNSIIDNEQSIEENSVLNYKKDKIDNNFEFGNILGNNNTKIIENNPFFNSQNYFLKLNDNNDENHDNLFLNCFYNNESIFSNSRKMSIEDKYNNNNNSFII